MSIEILRYIENENHTIKYKNTMERYVGTPNQNKIWSKEFQTICAESFEDCLKVAQKQIVNYFRTESNTIFSDLFFQVSHKNVVDNLFWNHFGLGNNTGKKYRVSDLEVI
jgi:hypothetical protein